MPELKPERRQLIKAGALVWTVPVVSMAVAAPAFAVSGADLSTSTITSPVVTGNGTNRKATFSVTIKNTGEATTSALQVRITFSGTAPTGQAAPAGWTVAVDPSNANVLVYTSGTQLVGSGGTVVVPFVIEPGNSSTTAVVALTPGNGIGKTFASVAL